MFALSYNFQNFGLLFRFIFPAMIACSVKFVCSCVLFLGSYKPLAHMVLIFDFSHALLLSCMLQVAWYLYTGDQATVYISVVCVSYGGW